MGYSGFPDLQRLQAEENGPFYDACLLERVVPLAAGLAERLDAGIDVLDISRGQGHAVNLLAGAFPRSRFAGIDLAPEGVEAARAEAAALGLRNATFAVPPPRRAGRQRPPMALPTPRAQGHPGGLPAARSRRRAGTRRCGRPAWSPRCSQADRYRAWFDTARQLRELLAELERLALDHAQTTDDWPAT